MLSEKSAQVIANLARYPPVKDKFETAVRSAVLVALLANDQGDLEVLLTLRSAKLRTNAGDAACPGAPTLSRHLLVVTPVVCFCPRLTTKDIQTLQPNPGEVSVIFTVPLEAFLNPPEGTYNYFDMSWLHSIHRMHRFERCGAHNFLLEADYVIEDADEHRGWPVFGMTAEVMINVARIAYESEPTFERCAPEQVDDPELMAMWYNKNQASRQRL
ncbi:hypothetical protein BGZ73_002163 [Actinomortierella ambigua]|nr:hypothetical protein BGZ73_002163 [Actinomortierella ambigua]